MITVTLNQIKEKTPYSDEWEVLLESLGKSGADDESLPLAHILKSNGLDFALWALGVLEGDRLKDAKLFICDIAERALIFIPKTESRPAKSIAVSRSFINGKCSLEELIEARDDAYNAYTDTGFATDSAIATLAAAAATYAAAYERDTDDADDAAATFAAAAAAVAAGHGERGTQKRMFIEFCNG